MLECEEIRTIPRRKRKTMPKIQPPKGYITATEVKNKLNISDAMIRYYVQKEQIKYIVPPGRKQGFYLEKDVNKLFNELNAFLNIENEEEEEVIFGLPARDDLREILRIGITLFNPDSNVSPEPPEWWIKVLEKNPEMSFVLKKQEQVLGYISTIPFKVGNEKAQQALKVDFLRDVNITPDDIETFDTGKHIDLYIMAIGMNPHLDRLERKKQGANLISRFISKIVELGEKGVIIEKIFARGDTRSGIKLLQAFGFCETLPPGPGKRAFIIDIKDSGAPVSLQYKQALKESSVLTNETH